MGDIINSSIDTWIQFCSIDIGNETHRIVMDTLAVNMREKTCGNRACSWYAQVEIGA